MKPRVLHRLAALGGYRLERKGLPPDMDDVFRQHYERCRPYTMTSAERLWALAEAVRYTVRAGVAGDYVECGVWKGGSALMMALALGDLGADDRSIWLYDTFAGMAEPSQEDGSEARSRWAAAEEGDHNDWCFSPLDEVASVMAGGYSPSRVRLVEGKVEDTIPRQAPDAIAVLRLDTDLYSSTRHELEHLWPRLSPGGVLLIDDYGHWEGARRAVDEFFRETPVLMHRIDYTGRSIQKAM